MSEKVRATGKIAPRRPRSNAAAFASAVLTLGVGARFWLTFGEKGTFGDGKAELLRLVDERGSLHRAASEMGMSYRHAWGVLRELEAAAGFSFVEHSARGKTSTLRLTDEGRRFLVSYLKFRGALGTLVERRFASVYRRTT